MIKFISYDGEWPNLCRGMLTVDINGEIHKFHYSFYKKDDPHLHRPFWTSGGSCGYDPFYIDDAPWELSAFKGEDFSEEIYEELLEIFNENVPFGCCGGCI